MVKIKLQKGLILFLLIITPLLSACEEEGADLFIEMALEWVASKNILYCSEDSGPGPEDCDLKVNMTEAGKYWAGFGKDPNLQAMVDTGYVVRDINKANALAEDGVTENDPDKLVQAQALRPKDWSYDQQLSVMMLTIDGNQQASSEYELDSEKKVSAHIEATMKEEGLKKDDAKAAKLCASTHFNMYTHRESALLAQLAKDTDNDPLSDAIRNSLIGQLDLVRKRMADLQANPASGICASYGGG